MEPYEGTEPYLFISYSHLDTEIVEKKIRYLQQNLCYVWYDKGNHAGDDWAEVIANHLVNCHSLLVFISRNSIKSNNVNNELTMALNYNKKVIPIYVEDVKVPLGWEIKIGNIHAVSLKSDSDSDLSLLIREIPKDVIKKTGSPFYKNRKHSFYFTCEEITDGFEGLLKITCVTNDKKEIIWSYKTPGPYEICAITSKNEFDENGNHPVIVNFQTQVKDDFFDMKHNGCIIFSIRVALLLPYPLYGPDGDGIIIFCLIDPLGDNPKVKVIDSMISVDSYNDGSGNYYKKNEYNPDQIITEKYKRILNILPKN